MNSEVPRDNKLSGLQDTDPMTFGKYKGTPMQDVPVSYLHYVCHNFHGTHVDVVKDYCKRSLSALKQKNRDLIWKL